MATTYPEVKVSGSPLERGGQYGEQARDRIACSLEMYGRAYKDLAGLEWTAATSYAGRFAEAIRAFEPRYLDEMRAIADGSGQELDSILALNVRTEIMLSAEARKSRAADVATPPAECTTITAVSAVTDSGHTLVAQNWDWLPETVETLVVLAASPDKGPSYVTVVEAGLLAKTGLNSCGLGVATNALITSSDSGAVGVPYHVSLRALLEAESLPAAIASLERCGRSSSANYMLAMPGGMAVDLEARPGASGELVTIEPTGGVLVHTNHFVATPLVEDVGLSWAPDSPARYARVARLLASRKGAISLELLEEVLRDHAGYPNSICAHLDEADKPSEQGRTAASLVMDLEERCIWLAEGNPCRANYRRLEAIRSS